MKMVQIETFFFGPPEKYSFFQTVYEMNIPAQDSWFPGSTFHCHLPGKAKRW
jgi:hypothetical protein